MGITKKNINSEYLIWIKKAYPIFAYHGPKGIKIERLSNEVGKSKSSFYHHFAELPLFIDTLLEYHMDQVKVIADKESECTTLEELISVLIEHKIDLLFNRQLRVHRENDGYRACFLQTNQIIGEAISDLWSEVLELKENIGLAQLVLKLSLENFFLQVTHETLNHSWLNNYFNELKVLIRNFKK